MDPQNPKDTSPETENKIPAKPEPQLAQPIETFQSDVERYIRENNVSAREAAAALKVAPKGPAHPEASALPPAPTPAPAPIVIPPSAMRLPNKEVHSPLNAPRADASVLLKQEVEATLPKPPPLPPLPIPKVSPTATPPIQTYQEDVQTFVREKNISSVTVAAAEEKRQQEQAAPIVISTGRSFTEKFTLVLASLVLIVAAVGGVSYIYVTTRPLPAQQTPSAPFIAVDQATNVMLNSGSTRGDIMQQLVVAKNNTKLALGLVAQLTPALATSSGPVPIDTQTFFGVLTPNIPPQLLRSLAPNFLLGVHSFDTNQPFLILSTDSYENGYAGMLAWETTMPQDLSPLFNYTPVVSTQPPPTTTGTSTASTTASHAAPAVLQTPFKDTIIANHDTRAILGSAGQIQFLWTFLDRNTILITTNPNTVQEIITRQKAAPTITIPGH